jgi:putative NADPH-quinone reductase
MLTVTAETKAQRFAPSGPEHPLHHIERGILKFCGYEVLPSFVIADVYAQTDAQRRHKLVELRRHVRSHFTAAINRNRPQAAPR